MDPIASDFYSTMSRLSRRAIRRAQAQADHPLTYDEQLAVAQRVSRAFADARERMLAQLRADADAERAAITDRAYACLAAGIPFALTPFDGPAQQRLLRAVQFPGA